MEIILKNISDLKEYDNNPRINDDAVDKVAKSIRKFGFKVPVVIDKNNTIVCGHTRLKASKQLGLKEIPCIVADDLNEEQIKAYRIADNRSSDFAEWDFELLEQELKQFEKFNPSDVGFDEIKNAADEFFTRKNDEYNDFIEKFKPEASTDECYTPKEVYDKVCDFVEEEYDVSRDNFVRPFYPGGDYQKFEYKDTDIVVDNPPFSIQNKILNYYNSNNIKYFLFCDGLTVINRLTKNRKSSIIIVDCRITYENGSNINTNFVTNLDKKPKIKVRKNFLKDDLSSETKTYKLPQEVITIKQLSQLSRSGYEMDIDADDFVHVNKLENYKHIYGSNIILKSSIAKSIHNAIKDIKAKKEKEAIIVEFNDKEKEILRRLNERK